MSLHLTRISNRYTLQVSDRLVSGAVVDSLANKNLIYWARDAIVTIGYSGLAYELSPSNFNMPTDEWIAEKLCGEPISRGPDGIRPSMFRIKKAPRWLDIGQSIEFLRSELQQSLEKLPQTHRKLPFSLTLAGWQQTRRRGVVPLIANILKEAGSAAIIIDRPSRHWHLRGQILCCETPVGYLTEADRTAIQKTLSTLSPDDTEAFLLEQIRGASMRFPNYIGQHCISILLPPPTVAPIRVRFMATTTHTAIVQSDKLYREIPIAFSPWIIGPNMLSAPSIISGSCQFQLGPHRIVIEAPDSQGSLNIMSSLSRPLGPS
jgi:hypothetical protein